MYRFCKFAEKDPETGYNQFEARLYDSRILRWNTTDPSGQYFSPYMAMGNNWPGIVDRDGRFDSRKEARMFRRENNTGGQIQKNYKGSYSIVINENTSYYDGMLLEYTNPDASAFPLESVTISTFSSYYSKSFGFSLDRMLDKGYANNIQEYENWEGNKGLKEKGIPTMSIATTFIVTGGLSSAAYLTSFSEYIIPSLSLVNSIHSVSGNPLCESFESVPYVSTAIDGVSFISNFTDPAVVLLKVPTIVTDGVSLKSDIHNLP